nr:putative LysR-type transcriptional regulator domain protein [Yersinia pestis PY-101]
MELPRWPVSIATVGGPLWVCSLRQSASAFCQQVGLKSFPYTINWNIFLALNL